MIKSFISDHLKDRDSGPWFPNDLVNLISGNLISDDPFFAYRTEENSLSGMT